MTRPLVEPLLREMARNTISVSHTDTNRYDISCPISLISVTMPGILMDAWAMPADLCSLQEWLLRILQT